jgi:hypothetical protein
MSPFHQELIKSILQLLGALLIAWVTVRLALKRFKTERGWERQTSTLADLLVAIEEMDRLNDIWLAVETNERRQLSDERRRETSVSYAAAMRDFEKGAAVAAVLLPPEIYSIVKQLRTELKTGDYASMFERLDADGASLQKARELLIDAGRKLQQK